MCFLVTFSLRVIYSCDWILPAISWMVVICKNSNFQISHPCQQVRGLNKTHETFDGFCYHLRTVFLQKCHILHLSLFQYLIKGHNCRLDLQSCNVRYDQLCDGQRCSLILNLSWIVCFDDSELPQATMFY